MLYFLYPLFYIFQGKLIVSDLHDLVVNSASIFGCENNHKPKYQFSEILLLLQYFRLVILVIFISIKCFLFFPEGLVGIFVILFGLSEDPTEIEIIVMHLGTLVEGQDIILAISSEEKGIKFSAIIHGLNLIMSDIGCYLFDGYGKIKANLIDNFDGMNKRFHLNTTDDFDVISESDLK